MKRTLWLILIRPMIIGKAAGLFVGRVLPFLFVVWFVLMIVSICLTSVITRYFGWDKPLIEWAKAHHMPVAERYER